MGCTLSAAPNSMGTDAEVGVGLGSEEGLSSVANPAIVFFLAETVKPWCQSMRLFLFKEVGGEPLLRLSFQQPTLPLRGLIPQISQ